jgi:hypothetical protein
MLTRLPPSLIIGPAAGIVSAKLGVDQSDERNIHIRLQGTTVLVGRRSAYS